LGADLPSGRFVAAFGGGAEARRELSVEALAKEVREVCVKNVGPGGADRSCGVSCGFAPGRAWWGSAGDFSSLTGDFGAPLRGARRGIGPAVNRAASSD